MNNNEEEIPSVLPVILENSNLIYPFMVIPIFLTAEESINAVEYSLNNDSMIFIAISNEDMPENLDDCYKIGVVGSIMRRVSMPDGRMKILFQGLSKAIIKKQINDKPLMVEIDIVEDEKFNQNKIDAILEVLREKVERLASLEQSFPPDLISVLDDNNEPYRISDLISSALRLEKKLAIELYSESNIEDRLITIIQEVSKLIDSIKLQKNIKSRVNKKIDKHNKEYFLREQLKEIHKELGDSAQKDEEVEEYRKKFNQLKKFMPKDGIKELKKQIEKFQRYGDSGESGLIQNYIEWVLEIPFDKISNKSLSVDEVETQLNKDHFSLEKPKDRIAEFFAVQEFLALRGLKTQTDKGTILCFVGPPGVGKTSLANSIAKALKRELVKIALGGLEDVNELRGHRRTYIGAMPGRMVQGLVDAKTMNPVIVLDEIDKVGQSHRGDPTAVLLEILDPEQNSEFRDYYINFNIDLSKAIFIATANDMNRISAPLRDRMEFIHINSYTPQEKFNIAKKYLIPQELKRNGLKNSEFSVTKTTLENIIENYTRESGVRNLRRVISKLIRKGIKELLKDMDKKKISITVKNLKNYLDNPIFELDKINKKPTIGVVNGLAWTSVGGDVLKVEAIKIEGKGGITLTGKLGEVMKESTKIALSVVKGLIDKNIVEIDCNKIPQTVKEKNDNIIPKASDIYHKYDLHIHFPAGAVPKDGPSAGITTATAIASIFSERAVRNDLAMTGELNLSGEVMPIGGLKEKLIAAYKASIKLVLVSRKNFEMDLDDIPDEVKDNLEIKAVDRIEDVLKYALY